VRRARQAGTLLAGVVALAAGALRAQTLEPNQQAAAAPPTANQQLKNGLAALKANDPQRALNAFKLVLLSDPDNEVANLLAATAEVGLHQGAAAVAHAEKARQIDPNNWKVHTTLVIAYAEAGKTAERDAERATLRKLHSDPQAKDAMQANGFLLDMFAVNKYKVDAVEYFKPVGKFHVYYRFLVRNAADKRVWEFALKSDDLGQASWAQAHADLAAKGERQFSLEGDGGGSHMEYRLFSGDPGYDAVKEVVVHALSEQAKPFPGEAQ
jgi:Tfp pilus assembly protein PilF